MIRTPAINEITAAVERRRDQVVRLCSDLISIPSRTGEEQAVQEFVAAYLKHIGLSVDMWEPKSDELVRHPAYVPTGETFEARPVVVGTWKGAGRGRSLLINGHVDVVTEEPVARWVTNPWKATIKDGRIYGRGAADMKSGLAAAITAIESLRESGFVPLGDVVLESVPSEESGGNGTVAAVARGYRADAGIFPEPTSCQIQPAHRGAAFWRIMVPGKASHGGTKYKGVSAVEKGILIAERLRVLEVERNTRFAGKHPLYKDYPLAAPVTLGKFNGGQFTSAVPEECTLEGCIEFVPGEFYADVSRQFEGAVQEAADGDSWLREHRPQIEWFGLVYDPAETGLPNPFVDSVIDGFRVATGSAPLVNGFEAGTDMRIMANYLAMPGVMFGPGDIEHAHAPNESVSIEQLVLATKVIALTIAGWCGGSK
jgi:acetylornithine deacetylase